MAVLPMYMGVILDLVFNRRDCACAPHVYGGDPNPKILKVVHPLVLPMYMGVILPASGFPLVPFRAPHVYGGDPKQSRHSWPRLKCSPCIWG